VRDGHHPTVDTAQETFRGMIREQIAPRLRTLGFKGSGQRFTLPSESHWALLGFQRSAWGDSNEGSFTINLTVVSKAEWEASRSDRPYRRAAPQANAYEGVPTWEERIGMLMPGDLDQWWQIRAGEPTDALAVEIVGAIEDYALPEMRRQIAGSPDARAPLWASPTWRGPR
jgi:Domain of unknown function (DUF4304)